MIWPARGLRLRMARPQDLGLDIRALILVQRFRTAILPSLNRRAGGFDSKSGLKSWTSEAITTPNPSGTATDKACSSPILDKSCENTNFPPIFCLFCRSFIHRDFT